MAETEKDARLLDQIKQEAEELRSAPVIPIEVGPALRCHLCGQPCTELYDLDTMGQHKRLAGPCCHPEKRRGRG